MDTTWASGLVTIAWMPLLTDLTSLHQLDLTRPPFLREEGFKRAVEAQDGEPTLARHRLDPVAAFHALRLFGAEVDGRGAIGTRHGGGRRIALAAGARIALRRVEHRSGLVVIDGERPERFGRDVLRKRALVGLAAVEGIHVRVEEAHQILRADLGNAHDHAGGVQGVGVVEGGPRIECARAGRREGFEKALLRYHRRWRLEVVAAFPQHVTPHRIFVVEPIGMHFGEAPVQDATGGVAELCRVG